MDIEKFRHALLQRKRDLLAISELSGIAAKTVELDQSRVGRLSRMDALQSQAMSQASNRRSAVELARISAALQRIGNDKYGCCTECGDTIPIKRLEFDPSANLCVECASLQENG